MARTLSLTAAPTFDAVVSIPQLGGEPVEVRFTFKHRTQDQLKAFAEAEASPEAPDRPDEEAVMDCASAWELTEEFTLENVRTFCQHFGGARFAITGAYLRAFVKARLGN